MTTVAGTVVLVDDDARHVDGRDCCFCDLPTDEAVALIVHRIRRGVSFAACGPCAARTIGIAQAQLYQQPPVDQ